MKKVSTIIMMIALSLSTAYADIIDPGMPFDPHRPIPAPEPEPVDDGEVVVIKTLLFVGIIITMLAVMYFKNKKVKEY